MKVAHLQETVKQALPPIQPWIKLYANGYVERLVNLNPVNSKSMALFYQFTTNFSEDKIVDFIPEYCNDFIFAFNESKIHSFFMGMNTNTQKIILKANTTYFCVKPYSFFGTKGWKASPKELYGHQYMLADVLNTNDLERQILEAPSFDERVSIFQTYYLKQWVNYDYQMGIEEYLAMVLYNSYASFSSEDIEKYTGYSPRYCRKKFGLMYNISPQKYSNIVRFQQSVNMLLDEKKIYTIPDIVHQNGYFDEAHFIRDFKSYSNYSPMKFKHSIDDMRNSSTS